jgi:murein L,D-transpeptidase YafK
MMISRRGMLLGTVALVAGCSTKFKTYYGPPVTRVQVFKALGVMQLMHNDKLLQRYNFELGFAPRGHKQFEGDGKTPEGDYYVDRKNPDSRFYLSIGISYPNARDRAYARAHGQRPGGDIFIHGTPGVYLGEKDWTWGCIAVTNEEMEDVYSMVRQGTPISIYP